MRTLVQKTVVGTMIAGASLAVEDIPLPKEPNMTKDEDRREPDANRNPCRSEALAQPVVGDEGRREQIAGIADRAAQHIFQSYSWSTLREPENLLARLQMCARQAVYDADAILSLSTPVVGGGWLPIDQLPEDMKDGRKFIVSDERGDFDFAIWHRDHVCGVNDGWAPFTHFRPLPEPPATDPHTMDRAGMAQEVEQIAENANCSDD